MLSSKPWFNSNLNSYFYNLIYWYFWKAAFLNLKIYLYLYNSNQRSFHASIFTFSSEDGLDFGDYHNWCNDLHLLAKMWQMLEKVGRRRFSSTKHIISKSKKNQYQLNETTFFVDKICRVKTSRITCLKNLPTKADFLSDVFCGLVFEIYVYMKNLCLYMFHR